MYFQLLTIIKIKYVFVNINIMIFHFIYKIQNIIQNSLSKANVDNHFICKTLYIRVTTFDSLNYDIFGTDFYQIFQIIVY